MRQAVFLPAGERQKVRRIPHGKARVLQNWKPNRPSRGFHYVATSICRVLDRDRCRRALYRYSNVVLAPARAFGRKFGIRVAHPREIASRGGSVLQCPPSSRASGKPACRGPGFAVQKLNDLLPLLSVSCVASAGFRSLATGNPCAACAAAALVTLQSDRHLHTGFLSF